MIRDCTTDTQQRLRVPGVSWFIRHRQPKHGAKLLI